MRAFICIGIPGQIAVRMAQIGSSLPAYGVRAVNCENMHITTHFFKNIDRGEFIRLLDAFRDLNLCRFRVSIRGISSFCNQNQHGREKVLFANISEGMARICEVHKRISLLLDSNHITYDRKEFAPHITVARLKCSDEAIDMISKRYSDVELGSFDFSRLSVTRSELHSKGPIYTTLLEKTIDGN